MTYRLLFYIVMGLFLMSSTGCMKDDPEDEKIWECLLVEIDGEYKQVPLDKTPEYFTENFYKPLLRQIKYPAEARENGVEGRVDATYFITEFGIMQEIEITKSPHELLSQALKDAFNEVYDGKALFSPAIYKGKPVKVKAKFFMIFRLEEG